MASIKNRQSDFESIIADITRSINGQFPRPWMTTLEDPTQANVFVVGRNQAKTFPVEAVGSQQRYLDALFNRNGQSCRKLYDETSGGWSSPTRRNIDLLGSILKHHGVTKVLETNVICYSTPMSRDLRHSQHLGGSKLGSEIFQVLLKLIRPRVLIVHGAGATGKLSENLGVPLPNPNNDSIVEFRKDDQLILIIPSLAPPAYNKWSHCARKIFEDVATCVVSEVAQSQSQWPAQQSGP